MNEQLLKAAEAIKDEALRTNAVNLVTAMFTVMDGMGDNVIHWRPSFVRVIQPTTDTDSISGNAKPGAIVLGDTVQEKGFDIHVLRVFDSRVMWNPDLNVKQIVCQSIDAKLGWRFGECRSCENQKFVDNKPGPCKKQKSFLAISKDLSSIAKIDLARSQYSVGADWEKNIKPFGGKPAYSRVFHLTAKKAEKGKANYVLDPARTEQVAEGDVFEFLTVLFQHIRAARMEEVERFYEGIKAYKAKQDAAKAAGAVSEDAENAPGAVDVELDSAPASDAQSGDKPNYVL